MSLVDVERKTRRYQSIEESVTYTNTNAYVAVVGFWQTAKKKKFWLIEFSLMYKKNAFYQNRMEMLMFFFLTSSGVCFCNDRVLISSQFHQRQWKKKPFSLPKDESNLAREAWVPHTENVSMWRWNECKMNQLGLKSKVSDTPSLHLEWNF